MLVLNFMPVTPRVDFTSSRVVGRGRNVPNAAFEWDIFIVFSLIFKLPRLQLCQKVFLGFEG